MRLDYLAHCAATGKRMYADRRTASKIARLHHEHMSVYRCEDCQHYHVGHLPPDIIRGTGTRTDRYRPVRHARGDDHGPETDRLEELRTARDLIVTGRRHIRGVSRDQAIARIDAEIARVTGTLLTA